MRLNQFLAFHLGLSRRKSEIPILNAEVKINGQVCKELSTRVSEEDEVEVYLQGNWKKINQKSIQTIVFYKPPFCVTSKYDPQRRRTIYDLIPKKYQALKPAGRLDFLSEGILVLSNDGKLLQQLTHPKFEHKKTYFVGCSKTFNPETMGKLNSSELNLEGYNLNPMRVVKMSASTILEYSYLKLSDKLYWYEFELTEGRNNQIRKICKQFENGVTRLIRVNQGDYSLSYNLFKEKIIEL